MNQTTRVIAVNEIENDLHLLHRPWVKPISTHSGQFLWYSLSFRILKEECVILKWFLKNSWRILKESIRKNNPTADGRFKSNIESSPLMKLKMIYVNCNMTRRRQHASYSLRTTDTKWRHNSKKPEIFGRCGRQNMLWRSYKFGIGIWFLAVQLRRFPHWASVVRATRN